MKRDYGNILLWSAVLVGAPRWAGAMLSADVGTVTGGIAQFLNVLNVISGLAMGLLEVLVMAYMLDSLRKNRPTTMSRGKKRINWKWWGVLLFSLGLLILTPAILAPYIVSRMNEGGIVGILPAIPVQLLWSVGVTLAPLFVVGGVAFARAGLVQTGEVTKVRYPRTCEKCDFVAKDRYAYSAHQKKHK